MTGAMTRIIGALLGVTIFLAVGVGLANAHSAVDGYREADSCGDAPGGLSKTALCANSQ
ncbi:hypothetical protein WOC76_19865 [Methylocystis sp. IM3]|uniref:hypothetical protein n=1 Tax=unclassified Methylocystis TaxID=2625913 RepID=UPI0030F4E874